MDTEDVKTDMDNAVRRDGLVDERAQADFEDRLYNENRYLREKLHQADAYAEELGEAIARLEQDNEQLREANKWFEIQVGLLKDKKGQLIAERRTANRTIRGLERRIAALERAAREEDDFQDWRTGEGRA